MSDSSPVEAVDSKDDIAHAERAMIRIRVAHLMLCLGPRLARRNLGAVEHTFLADALKSEAVSSSCHFSPPSRQPTGLFP